MQYIVKSSNSSSELYHHGVKGMHWGVTRGPKPTTGQRRAHKLEDKINKREAKAQKFEEKAKTTLIPEKRAMYLREAERARTGKLSRRQRQVIVGASIVAAYATYKFVDSGEAHRLITNGKAAIEGKRGDSMWHRNESLADKTLKAEDAFNKVALGINPDYGQPGTTNNCRRCTFAYIKARQGYDVSATKTLAGTGQTNIGLYNATTDGKKIKGGVLGAIKKSIEESAAGKDDFVNFVNGNTKNGINTKVNINDGVKNFVDMHASETKSRNVFSALSKMPNGSRGEVQMTWLPGGGHSMAWEIFDGKPSIFDCQTRKMYDEASFGKEVGEYLKTVNLSRLDNVNIDATIIGRWIQNAKPK